MTPDLASAKSEIQRSHDNERTELNSVNFNNSDSIALETLCPLPKILITSQVMISKRSL